MGLFSKKKSGMFHLSETNMDFGLMPYTVTVDPDAQVISFHLYGSKKTIHEIDFDKIQDCDAYISPVYEEKKAWIATMTGVSVGSDAFFPFGDNVERARKSGVEYIAQPGGSIRDDHVIDTCNKYGIVMAFTGMRLFHH